ncbi:MAG: 1-acyl-sn-glycerol-3-phosphate acyltransferase [Promethearchaeota archaeon]
MTTNFFEVFKQKANPLTVLALQNVPACSLFHPKFNRAKLLVFYKGLYCFFRIYNLLEVRNAGYLTDALKKHEHLLLVANHSGFSDVLMNTAIHAHFNHMVFTFINGGGFNFMDRPLFPTLLHFSEMIPRYGTGQQCVDRMVNRLLRGDHVFLYPEGTYNFGFVSDAYTGVARVAYEYEKRTGKKLVILPSCAIGSHEAYNPHRYWKKAMKHRRKRKRAIRQKKRAESRDDEAMKQRVARRNRFQEMVNTQIGPVYYNFTRRLIEREGRKIIVKFGKPFTLQFSSEPSGAEFKSKANEVMHEIARIWGQKRIYPNISKIFKRLNEKQGVKSRYYYN